MPEKNNMRSLRAYIQSHQTEAVIFIAALGIRVIYAVAIQLVSGSHGFISFSDAEFFYYRSALNLLYHHSFSLAPAAPYLPEAYHTPLYPLFIAVLLSMRFPLFAIVVAQDIVWAFATVLIYRISVSLYGSRMLALVAACIAIVEPMSVYWSGLLMSDTLSASLFILALYLLVAKRTYSSMFVLGLSALARPIALYFALVFLCMVLYQAYSAGTLFRPMLTKIAVSTLIFIVAVFPWYLRNKIVFDTWSFTSASWYLMYGFPVGEFSSASGLSHPNVPLGVQDDFTRFDFKYLPLYRAASWQLIAHDPIGFSVIYAKRSLYSFVSNRYDYLIHDVFASEARGIYSHTPAFVLNLILALGEIFWFAIYALVVVAVFKKDLFPWWLFFVSLLCINAVLSGGINPVGTDMSRYSLPFYAFFFTFAGVGFMQLSRFVRSFSTTR